MKQFLAAAAVLLASITVAYPAGRKVSPIEVTACTSGDFVSAITATGAVTCGTPGAGSGDVVGPGSATDGNVVLYDGTTGKLIKNSSIVGSNVLVSGGALGTPSSGTLTNATGLPISTGVSGLGTGIATFLATPSSANLRAALTDEVGTGAAYFVGGALGTPASATLTNATGLPASTGISGLGTGVGTFLGSPTGNVLATWLESGAAASNLGFTPPHAPAGSANTPLFDDGSGGFTNGTRSGNTTKVATASGSLTSGNCAKWDASGNAVDSGAPCGTGSGSVTSVGLSVPGSSIFGVSGSPVTGSGTLGLTTTGTSGGVPYFDTTGTLSSSAALTANRLVLGGGAGAAPTVVGSLGTTTTVLHGNAGGAPTFGAVANADLTNSSITLNAGASTGLTAPGAMSLGSTYTFGATSDTPRFAGLGLGGAAAGANSLKIYGGTSGSITFAVPATAGSNTITFPAGTTDFSSTGGTSQFVKQASTGAALTVARPACADLSDAGTGCSTALANLTATDTTLTLSGTYNATTARTIGLNLDRNNTWTKAQAVTPVSLSISGGSVAVDASLSNDFTLTANGAFTLANPSNLLAGQTLNFWITQDGTGTRVMTLGSQYQAAGGSSLLILSTAASAKDLLTCVSDTTTTMTCALLKAIAH